jgi:hypothetical protein
MEKTITQLALATFLFTGSVFAQVNKTKNHNHDANIHRTCGTMDHHEYLKQTRPNYEKDFNEFNKKLDEYIKNESKNSQQKNVNITIPVVVHILYQNATENISDARAIEQVTVLNEDFQKNNADTTIIPSIFKSRAAGTNITFCLAQRDPNGNPTNGIIHKATTVSTFSTDDKVKSSAQGGDDAWNVSKYVNIWVCDLGTSLLGYGEFPTASLSNTYGLVLNYRYTGKTGASAPFNRGRTGTHEFGHCFNLFHIWGDDGTACTGSDQVNDTPNQKGENYGSPAFPQGTSATGGCCNAADQSSMYMNYMDYSDDAAMAMFTAGQIARINAVVNTAPWNILQSSDGCNSVNLVANDAGIFNVASPNGILCSTSIQPTVTLKNNGNTVMTTCDINYKVDNGAISTFNWTGNLASLATTVVNLPSIPVTAGNHTLTVYTSNPNGSGDGNATNDQSTSTFTVVAVGNALPYFQGFETTPFPTAQGITLSNPDNSITWSSTTTAKFSGTRSAFVDNWNYANAQGQRDEMILPNLDFSNSTNSQLTFQVAYTYWTTTGTAYSDTLEILASGDCGATYTSVYKKWRDALKTAPPVSSNNNAFVPTASQWRLETVNLAQFDGNNNVIVKFRNITDYEDNLYVDDINIAASTVGLNQLENTSVYVNLYPNPTSGILKYEVYNQSINQKYEINVYDLLGKKVMQVKDSESIGKIDISNLNEGVYQIEVKGTTSSYFKKLILTK